MTARQQFKHKVMMDKIAEAYGTKSYFSTGMNGYVFKIMAQFNDGPHVLQSYPTNETDYDKALAKIYHMAQEKLKDGTINKVAFPIQNRNPAFGQT